MDKSPRTFPDNYIIAKNGKNNKHFVPISEKWKKFILSIAVWTGCGRGGQAEIKVERKAKKKKERKENLRKKETIL